MLATTALMKLDTLALLGLLGLLGCSAGVDEVAVTEVAEPDADVYALYQGAPSIAVDGAFELDVETCAYSRTELALPLNAKAFALTQATTDGRCVVWLGIHRASGLFAPHQVCVVDRDGTLPIGARPAANQQIELFSTHARCNLHFRPLAYLARLASVPTSTFDLDLETCAFEEIAQEDDGEPLGSWYVLTRPGDRGNHCDVWTWYFDDLGPRGVRRCRFARSGAVTAQLDNLLRIEISGTACSGSTEY